MRGAINVFVALVFSAVGCGGCSEQCWREYHGGGQFSIELSGDIEGTLQGQGLTQSQLETYAPLASDWFGWSWFGTDDQGEVVIGEQGDVLTGGLCAASEKSSETCAEGFVAFVPVPDGALSGAPEWSYVRVTVMNDAIRVVPHVSSLEVADEPGAVLIENEVVVEYGLTGSAQGLNYGTPALDFSVTWSMEEGVNHREDVECPESGGGGGWFLWD